MKFILILHLCSVVTGKCMESSIPGLTYTSHYDCALGGYKMAYKTFQVLKDDDYYGLDRINDEKIAIKFECKEIDTNLIVPPKKPKITT